MTILNLGSKSDKLKQYEEHFQAAPECVLKYLKISKSEVEENRESSEKVEGKGSEEGCGEGQREGMGGGAGYHREGMDKGVVSGHL